MRKQKKNNEVPHPSDSTADVPNEEHVPKHSNDPLLRGEDRMKLTELMNIRVESLDDESLGAQEDASKQGRSRIEAIDRDTEVTLVETQRRNDENDDNLMFDTSVFDDDEIVVETKEFVINVATTTKEPVESTVTTTVPSQKSKDKGKEIMIEPEKPLKKKDQIELDEELAREIEAEEQADFDEVQKLFEKHMKWINIIVPMEEDLPSKKVQKEVRSEKKAEGSSRKKSIGRKRAKDKQEQESSKRQRVKDDKEEKELMKCFELAKEEEITINVIPLATKVSVVGFQIHIRGKPGYYEIFRADGSSKLYHVFSQLLSEFDREDLVNLWKLVKAKHGDNRPEEDFERVLWGDLRVMFEPDVESEVWRSLQGYKVTVWKLYDSCGVHFVRFKHLHVFMLVEKRYPLTPITITNMLNKKLQADQWNEMVYQLLKLMIQKMNIKFRGGLLGLKGFLKLLLLSTAGTKVNAAGLQLLEELLLSEG
ncbi:hypothetical protein Tco_0122654 [Tanacetum coccineum]